MRLSCFLFAAFLAGTTPAVAADLTKLDRKLTKEPTYQGQPRYALLAFGAEAKSRVWVVIDGDTLYVDRNGNGDLTEEGEKVARKNKEGEYRQFEAGEIRDGALTHKELFVTQSNGTKDMVGGEKEFARLKAAGGEPLVYSVRLKAERAAEDKRKLPKHIGYIVNGDGTGWLAFARKPAEAPILHFNGPWTMEVQDNKQRFTAGHKTMLQIGVGSRGIGPGTFTWVLYPDTIPNDVYPVAETTFPAQKSGAKPITQKDTLKERC